MVLLFIVNRDLPQAQVAAMSKTKITILRKSIDNIAMQTNNGPGNTPVISPNSRDLQGKSAQWDRGGEGKRGRGERDKVCLILL